MIIAAAGFFLQCLALWGVLAKRKEHNPSEFFDVVQACGVNHLPRMEEEVQKREGWPPADTLARMIDAYTSRSIAGVEQVADEYERFALEYKEPLWPNAVSLLAFAGTALLCGHLSMPVAGVLLLGHLICVTMLRRLTLGYEFDIRWSVVNIGAVRGQFIEALSKKEADLAYVRHQMIGVEHD